MVDYKIVKYCRMCKKRFIVLRGQSNIIFCKECKEKMDNDNSRES